MWRGRNLQPSHKQAKPSVRIPNLRLRKHVADVEKSSDGRQPSWLVCTQHPFSMTSSICIPHKSHQQCALAGGDFTNGASPTNRPHDPAKGATSQPEKIPPSSHRSHMPLNPGAKPAPNSSPLSPFLPYGNGPRRTMTIDY